MAVELTPGRIGPRVERCLPDDLPARQRALGVIDGVLTGRAWADDDERPSWVVVVETTDGTIYAGGQLTSADLAAVMRDCRTASGELIIGCSGPEDPIRGLLPPAPFYAGEAIDLTDRRPPEDEDALLAVPAGIAVTRIGPELLPQTEWYADTIHAVGSIDRWSELSIGHAALSDGAVVSESTAGPRVRGAMEMGVVTRQDHRGRGLGTLVSRHVARACEADGHRVWWNANAENAPSLAIARRIGFRSERRYEVVAYRTERS